MTIFIYHCFESLKRKVLQEANIDSVTTGDCIVLSNAILAKTKKSISETTLKRVYGFANTRFKPSSFTLNAMAEFCGYRNWEMFCSAEKKVPAKTEHEIDFFTKAEMLTRNTMQALKNRSGIPWQYTIGRRIVHEHLAALEDEQYNASIIIGAAGAGKTIGLCHWINDRLTYNAVTDRQDMYLFFSSQLLNSSLLHEDSLEQWILNLLGVKDTQNIGSLFEAEKRKLYLIIDGLDEHFFKTEQFEYILNQIVDLVSCYKDAGWLKVIMTMTTVSWKSFKTLISQFHIIRDKWHLGLIQHDPAAISNITPFSYDELRLLSEKINPETHVPDSIPADALKFLSHPEYFTYFYHSFSADFSLSHANSAYVYQLISDLILDKIYTGRNSTEKVTLIDSVIRNIHWKKNKPFANKTDVQGSIKAHNSSYRDLLNSAILSETNKSNPLKYEETVEFVNNNLTRYFITKDILEKNEDAISLQLVQEAQFITVGNDDYLGVIKWLITYAVHIRDFKIFTYLTRLKLHPNEKVSLILFIAQTLDEHYKELSTDQSFNTFLKTDFHFFNSFFKSSYFDTGYAEAVHTFLKFDLPEEKILLLRELLAISHMLELNLGKTQEQLDLLSGISDDVLNSMPFNTIACIKTVAAYFTTGKTDKAPYAEITHLVFNPDEITKHGHIYENHFMITVYVTMVYNNVKKGSRFINILRTLIPKINGSLSPELKLWMSVMECRTAIFTGNTRHGHALFRYINNRYQHQQHNFTLSMRLSFLVLKSQAISFLHLEGDLLLLEKQISSLATQMKYAFYDTANKAFLYNTKRTNHLAVEDIQKAYFALVKTVRTKGLRLESFIVSFPDEILSERRSQA